MKKILHIITRLDHGGSSNIVLTFCQHLTSTYDVTLLVGRTKQEDWNTALHQMTGSQPTDKKVNLIYLPYLTREINLWLDMIAFFNIYRFIRTNRFDLVHTHTSKAGFIGRWAAWFAKVPILVHMPHGHIFYGYYSKSKSYLFVFIERFTALITTKIITLTQRGITEHLQYRVGKLNQYSVINNGLDYTQIYTRLNNADLVTLKRRVGVKENIPVIIAVGRLEKVKGFSYLINALHTVNLLGYPFQFLLVGDGSLRTELTNQVVRMKLTDKTIFLGERDDVIELISISDLFVLPSLMEGFGIVLLEAMSIGKPVIATDVGGIPDIVQSGKTGLLVPPADPDALSQTIVHLLNHPQLRQEYGLAGKTRVLELFTRERMLYKLTDLYSSLI